jgi:hypothetical protein
MKLLLIHILDNKNVIHTLRYKLYNTFLVDKWINLTSKNLSNPQCRIHSVFNNRTKNDIPELFQCLKTITTDINKLYHIKLPIYDTFDNARLNYLHEEFEKFEKFLDRPLIGKSLLYQAIGPGQQLIDYFFKLNEYIHMCEDALNDNDSLGNPAGILYDLHPLGLHEEVQEEDKLFLESDFKWGNLYLGYNTLGKDWMNVLKDSDFEVVERDQVKPQKRFAAETWMNFNPEVHISEQIQSFYDKVKDLPDNLRNKIPLNDLNKLTLGRFLLGNLIIDQQFLDFDSNQDHWLIPNHECKLRWNRQILSTFRSVEKIEIANV